MSIRSSTALPPNLFVDTSAWYAILDPSDRNHQKASELAEAISSSHTQLYITNLIKAEAHALILNRLGHFAADKFLAQLATMNIITIYVTEADELSALALIAKYQDKDFSLTDATSFIVMDNLKLTTAFAFDRNFEQYGLVVL
jgi:predicted nucleic acid-binding protein